SVCSPTRYGILTGRYAWRTRLQAGVLGPYDKPLIAPGRLTVPALLAQHGYRTACIGKWHLGWDWPREGAAAPDFTRPIAGGPTARGFDRYFGTDVPNYPPYCFIENDRTLGSPTAQKTEQNLDGRPGPMLPGWKFDAILPALAERAVAWLGDRAAEKRPWLLYFAFTSPHEPIAPSEAFRGKSGMGPLADFIMETDAVVGQLLDALDRRGLADNTIVIFTSDNGHSTYTGLQELQKAGHEPSAHLRGYKADIWEGGHRVPFIVRWPGKAPPGTRCDQTVGLTDLMATCADLVGVRLPDDAGEDSASILPLLTGRADRPVHEAVVHHSARGQFAIRQGNWKLVLGPGPGGGSPAKDGGAAAQGPPPAQLYDLARDIGEKQNVADQQPDVVRQMTALLQKYVADGRSTPGQPQKNDVAVDIFKAGQTAPSRKPAGKAKA
ncbi:MAG: arylsulfatase, partial [Planctomycetes bacterium]|nr:arylsulfatase [Planctomycetota bacterium]